MRERGEWSGEGRGGRRVEAETQRQCEGEGGMERGREGREASGDRDTETM